MKKHRYKKSKISSNSFIQQDNVEEEIIVEHNDIINQESNDNVAVKDVQTANLHETQNDKTKTTNTKSIFKNYIFNALYQIFLIIVPLITTPYLSRVLLPEGVGKYSFASSIISYFVIFAALGFNLYGQREIAKNQGDKKAQSIAFWEIVIVRVFTTCVSVAVNIILCCFNVYGGYNQLMLILSINIFATIFDFSFVLQGNDAFGKLVLRNLIVRILSIVSIFTFVKSHDDVWIYTLITALSTLIGNLAIIFYIKQMIVKIPFKELKPQKRILPALKLFLPTIVVSIYTILDKTLIGLILKSDTQNGFYDQAYKVVSMLITLVSALSLVMVSRNSYEKSQGNINALQNNVYLGGKIVMFIGFPLMFGMMAIAQNMNLWFFGKGYTEVIILMIAFAPMIMMIGLNNVTGVQYLIAIGRERTFTVTVLCGAILNFTLNIILINTIGVIGTVIASVMAEMTILIIQLFILRKDISVKKFLLSGWKNFVSAGIMFVCLWLIKDYFVSSIINTCILILIGVIIYGTMILVLRDDLIKTLVNTFLKKGKKDEL